MYTTNESWEEESGYIPVGCPRSLAAPVGTSACPVLAPHSTGKVTIYRSGGVPSGGVENVAGGITPPWETILYHLHGFVSDHKN